VGWFPLGWREPFVPWYRASTRHVHAVNVTHVRNITSSANVRHVHRGRTDAVTVVSQQTFVSSRSAWRERHRVAHEDLVRAEVIRNRPPAERARASLAPDRPAARPPVELRSRETVVTRPPAAFTREGGDTREHRVFGTQSGDRERERRERRSQQEAAERAREAQRQVQTPPTTRPPAAQAQPVPQAQPAQQARPLRNVPPPQPQAQQAQPLRSAPPQQPQAQAQQPQASRSPPPQARQQSNEDRGSSERRPQRQTPRDRD
jgi:hypothetical protein